MKCSTTALFAGLVAAATASPQTGMDSSNSSVEMTTSTIFATQQITITSCAPNVTACPANSTVVVTRVVAVSTTVCPVSTSGSAAPVTPGSAAAIAMPSSASTVLVSSCTSCSASNASRVTRPAVASASGGVGAQFTSIPVNGSMSVATPTSPNMSAFTGAASKVGGSICGLVVLFAAAFAL